MENLMFVVPKTLAERRAKFAYEAARIENAMSKRPINPEPWEKRDIAFRENMIMAVNRQCGSKRITSFAKLHADWVMAYKKMGWKYGKKRDVKKKIHPDLVSFAKLGKKEQEKDMVFFMLAEIARKMY